MMVFVLVENGVVVQRQPDEGDGLIEAEDHVVCGFLYADGIFVAPPSPPVSADAVRSEAYRRIVSIMPEYKQRNMMALAIETMQKFGTDFSMWPAQVQTVNADILNKWDAIKSIRQRSNDIEAMDPIPNDFVDDGYWIG